jgi:predicted ATPase
MYKINRFRIKGFRRLLDVNLQMQPFMTIIGINGVGKTSFLDAFCLLSASADGKLNSMLSKLGGVANILTRGKSDKIDFSIEMAIPSHEPLEYSLTLDVQGTGYSIISETLQQRRQNYSTPFMHINSVGQTIRYYETEKKKCFTLIGSIIIGKLRFLKFRKCFDSLKN